MAILTLTEASRATGIARSTLYGYIQRGTLNVTSHPDGGRGVDTVELEKVFGKLKQTGTPKGTPKKPTATKKKQVVVPDEPDKVLELLKKKVKQLERELVELKERLGFLEQRSLESPKAKGGKGKKKGR